MLRPLALLSLLSIAVLLAVRPAEAQLGRISGIVTDATTGDPLDSVWVRLAGTNLVDTTEADGRYFLPNVPVGARQLLAERSGYASSDSSFVLEIDQHLRIDFRLIPATLPGPPDYTPTPAFTIRLRSRAFVPYPRDNAL